MNFEIQTEGSRDMYKQDLETSISLHRGPVGEPGGEFGYWELRDTVTFGLLFLDTVDVRSLNQGAIWNFTKIPGLTMT